MAGVAPTVRIDWDVLCDQLVAELAAVPSVGRIHNRLRFDAFSNEERFKKKFQEEGSGKINAWTVTRVSQVREFFSSCEYLVNTNVVFDFWYTLDDENDSQRVFDKIVDDVLERFQGTLRLECLAEIQGPIQLVDEDHRYIAGCLVHHAELTTDVQHRVFQNTFR